MKNLFFYNSTIASILVFLHFRKMEMKKIFSLLSLLVLGISCDDGDIIVTNFDFEDQTLQQCSNFDFVFFTINPETNETLALQLDSNLDFLSDIGTTMSQISPTTPLVYRRFDEIVTPDYFCNPIPPATPLVTEEFVSTSGDVRLVTMAIQDDNDGIPARLEGAVFDEAGLLDLEASQDTDEDGIIDALDFDDDGDNVPTAIEIIGLVFNDQGDDDPDNDTIDMDNSPNTDRDFPNGDDILDYLDDDDDGDGVLTRNEDVNGNLNPTDDRTDENSGLDDYLNPNVNVTTIVDAFREHSYFMQDINLTVFLENLDFRNDSNEEVIRDITEINFGSLNNFQTIEILLTPDFN